METNIKISSCDLNDFKHAKTRFIDHLIGLNVRYQTCGEISALLNRIIQQNEEQPQ